MQQGSTNISVNMRITQHLYDTLDVDDTGIMNSFSTTKYIKEKILISNTSVLQYITKCTIICIRPVYFYATNKPLLWLLSAELTCFLYLNRHLQQILAKICKMILSQQLKTTLPWNTTTQQYHLHLLLVDSSGVHPHLHIELHSDWLILDLVFQWLLGSTVDFQLLLPTLLVCLAPETYYYTKIIYFQNDQRMFFLRNPHLNYCMIKTLN